MVVTADLAVGSLVAADEDVVFEIAHGGIRGQCFMNYRVIAAFGISRFAGAVDLPRPGKSALGKARVRQSVG